jgi:PP-loop superfamily ATP-utilizing enzyme
VIGNERFKRELDLVKILRKLRKSDKLGIINVDSDEIREIGTLVEEEVVNPLLRDGDGEIT